VNDTWPKKIMEQQAEIERLRADLTKWKARSQLMAAWMRVEGCRDFGSLWSAFVYDKSDAGSWFDDDGVPR
jgi:hypothetical protein